MTNVDIERQRLSARLKEYRKLAGMTQKELAEKLGKAQTVVSSWEIGTGCPNANELPAIAKALDVSISDICGQTTPKARLKARPMCKILDTEKSPPRGRNREGYRRRKT